ncbi:MAG: peptidylprolyl isomerase, partial [Psychromonas sp.]
LYPNEAPKTVENFLHYVQKDQFKGTTFHRVIDGFMVQGGGFLVSGKRAEIMAPITNESTNGLSNERGTIAMARTNSPHSASRQFFINQKDNTFLDAKGSQWGYAVFGKVTNGLSVIDDIAKVQTTSQDKPVQDIVINSIVVQENP